MDDGKCENSAVKQKKVKPKLREDIREKSEAGEKLNVPKLSFEENLDSMHETLNIAANKHISKPVTSSIDDTVPLLVLCSSAKNEGSSGINTHHVDSEEKNLGAKQKCSLPEVAESNPDDVHKLTATKLFDSSDNRRNFGKNKKTKQRDYFDDYIDNIYKYLENCQIAASLCAIKMLYSLVQRKNDFNGLLRLCFLVQRVAKRLDDMGAGNEFLDLYPLLDEVFQAVQNVEMECGKEKCTYVAWTLVYTAGCSMEIRNYDRAISIYDQCIFLLKCIFGEDASRLKLFSICHHNIGIAYHRTSRCKESINVLKKTIEVQKNVTDWMSEREKTRCQKDTLYCLRRVQNHLYQIGWLF